MNPRRIFVLETPESPWHAFLQEFFEDTSAEICTVHESSRALGLFDSQSPDVVFINLDFISMALEQKMKAFRQINPHFRAFRLGAGSKKESLFRFDECFDQTVSLADFYKRFTPHLPLPEVIRVIVIDDEEEIGRMVRDFLENRTQPSFHIQHTDDGKKGLEWIREKKFDVVVLDVKMPIMDGRDVYREIRTNHLQIPVVIFFDAISGEEIIEIRKFGKPAVMEKAARQSAMPEMMAVIKKLAYFG